MPGKVRLTEAQRRDLAFVVSHGWIKVYSPAGPRLKIYAPLRDIGLVTIRNIAADEQEVVFKIEPTDAGRAALKEADNG